jgi:uncharacterized protein with PIN domain
VALFPFGRTIHCTCGQRVGLAPRRRLSVGDDPRFLADAMLGRLARWLRLLGFDTVYAERLRDGDLVRRAIEEERWILTRDRALPREWRVSGVHVLAAEELLEQLRDVVRTFRLTGRVRPFSRCGECNAVLVPASREDVAQELPPHVLATQREFRRCPGCGRIYWRGSHTARMKAVIERVLEEA